MNLISLELLKSLWIGYALFCLFTGIFSLFRMERLNRWTRLIPGVLLGGGIALFIASALELFPTVSRPVLPWIYSASPETSLNVGFLADQMSAWGLALILLLFLARVFAGESSRHLAAAFGFSLAGWCAAWTAETLWAGLVGCTLLVMSAFLVRVGVADEDQDPARFLRSDLTRVALALLGIWTSAAGLEVLGFRWDFQAIGDGGTEHFILLSVLLLSLVTLILPWVDLSNLIRAEEKYESEVALIGGVLLPMALSSSLARVFENVATSHFMKGAGFVLVGFGVLFFLVYLAAKSVVERRRVLVRLFGSLVLAISFLNPSPVSMMFILGLGAVTGAVVIGLQGVPHVMRGVLLVTLLLIAAGLPGFLPAVYLGRLWGAIPAQPLEFGSILLLHAVLVFTLLREIAVMVFEKSEGTRIGQATVLSFAVLFLLTIWTTGTWTGGALPADLDETPLLQDLPWAPGFGIAEGVEFAEGTWIQLGLALLFPLLIFAFRKKDPFVTRPDSWGGFRRGLSRDLGLSWIFSGLAAGLSWTGNLFEEKLLDRVWSRYLPAAGAGIHRLRLRFSDLMDRVSDRLTDERWRFIVSPPAQLVQAMTNGRTQWYLFFGILSTFLLVIHFVVKLS